MGGYMGLPPVCCEYVLLPLANKAASLVYGMTEYSKVGNRSRERWAKKAESKRLHAAAEETRHLENELTSRPRDST